VLPTVVGQMVAARGAEESTSWRQPEDLVTLCQATAAEVLSLFAASRGRGRWSDHAALAHLLLGDDAVAIMAALKAAIRAGALPTDLGRSLAYAAALRVARFGSANGALRLGDRPSRLHLRQRRPPDAQADRGGQPGPSLRGRARRPSLTACGSGLGFSQLPVNRIDNLVRNSTPQGVSWARSFPRAGPGLGIPPSPPVEAGATFAQSWRFSDWQSARRRPRLCDKSALPRRICPNVHLD
jgi:hypothetical protein